MASARPSSHRFGQSVVHVEVGKHFGTAFLTNLSERSGLFLTAYHVISPAVHGKLPIKLRRGNSRGFAAKIVDINRERDLALLSAKVPANVHLRSFAIAPVHDVGRLTVLQMLNPDQGIIAPLFVSVPFAGETAVEMEVDGELVTIDRVWSQQGLQIAGGVSGAPVVSELDDAIVAVACAGADRLDQAFFVPLISAQVGARKRNGKMIANSIIKAQESIRLGRYPNGRGIALRCWLKTRESVRSLAVSGVYDRAHAIDRPSLGSALKLFMSSDKPVSILAGESGVGKSTSVAKLVQTIKCERPVLLLRAAQIPSGRESLKSALCDALKISDASTFDKVPAIAGPAPLIVLDGINEVTIARHEWPGFTRSQLAQFGDMVGRKGWKLLITTRVDRLEDITEIKHILGNKLFDPMPKPERSQLPPYIRLGSFDRDEFSELLRIYELPPSLPFPELRHPIVFRLAAEASVTDHGTGIRVRDLFAQYFSEIVTKIHFRCEGKNRDRIRELIEQWASTNSLRNSGRLSYEDLGESADEAIAEAGVAEGLFERVPGGYRFVYDEVYDYVRAGRLAQELDRQIRTAHEPSIALLKTARANGATFGSLARALELLADRFPETCERFADALADELAADAASMPPPASSDISTTDPQFKLSIAALSRLALEPVRTLSLVEKGGPFDRAKQYLPLLTSSGSLGAWGVHSHFPFMVSDDHLSYAFSEESMWRMIRLTAASRGRDSFPWRAKDVADDLAHEAARDALETTEHFKVVRHFVTGFPNEAFEKLSQGLAETERIGSEHSFGSFCAQVLAVYSDRYELTKLLKIVPQPMFYALFERLAKHHADKILDVFFDEKIGFVARPIRLHSAWPKYSLKILTWQLGWLRSRAR